MQSCWTGLPAKMFVCVAVGSLGRGGEDVSNGCGGVLAPLHVRDVGGPLAGRGQEGDHRGGVAQDQPDPGQVSVQCSSE